MIDNLSKRLEIQHEVIISYALVNTNPKSKENLEKQQNTSQASNITHTSQEELSGFGVKFQYIQ